MKVLAFISLAACVVVYAYSQTVNCPDLREKDPVLVRHPCNCSTYYVCTPPQPVPMPCPPGLHFYYDKQRCDWPWIVNCLPEQGCRRELLDENDAVFFEGQAHV